MDNPGLPPQIHRLFSGPNLFGVIIFRPPSSLIAFAFSNIASASLSAAPGKAGVALAAGLAEMSQGPFPVGADAAPVKFEPGLNRTAPLRRRNRHT